MDFQGIAIKKDDDKTIVLVLNIEKLAETIVVRGNRYNDDEKIKESLMSLLKETLSDTIGDFMKTSKLEKNVFVNIGTLVSAVASI